MFAALRPWMAQRPLVALTLIALLPRLIAAFFSQGYFAHDDHFLVIEAARSWADGFDYNNWLPWNQGEDPSPSGHSFFYVGLHYLLFVALKGIGLSDPIGLMVVVRILHAIWGLVVVRVGYRIALRLSNEPIAWRTGLFLALFYFMPFLSVRNLVETACIPFLMLGTWQLIKDHERPTLRNVLIAGVFIGLAVNVRFQTLFFAAGPGLVLLFQRRWQAMLVYGLGVLLPLAVIQSGIDLFLWGRPFAELTEYVLYNMANTTTYFDQPWYNYLLLLLGIFIPFLGVAVMFGFFQRRGPLLIWVPVLLFLAIHSYFPNKQERFILPIVPLFFVLGYTAWELWRERSVWWQRRAKLWRGQLTFAWTLNTVLLVVLMFSYSKRSRVEAMIGLQELKDIRALVVEDTVEGEAPMPPLFYLGQWDVLVEPWTDVSTDMAARLGKHPVSNSPDVILFIGVEDLPARVARAETVMGPLEILFEAKPGALDRAVHWLNPVNRNETIVVARTK
ncbi:MAG: glycosyltransferase family 39 protein [Flavobacteriales bacterium]